MVTTQNFPSEICTKEQKEVFARTVLRVITLFFYLFALNKVLAYMFGIKQIMLVSLKFTKVYPVLLIQLVAAPLQNCSDFWESNLSVEFILLSVKFHDYI